MNDLELDAHAEGIFKYLLEKTENPLDGIAIIGMALLKVFTAGTNGSVEITRFAEDFRRSLIESYNSRSNKGTETKQ